MMALGNVCSAWDDSVDHANLEEFNYGEIPDDHFVMTSWHDNEPIQEVFWFCRYTAFHPEINLLSTYLIQISEAPRKREMLGTYWTELDE